jgi:glycosyltransferase involved in cell wall biosynthesis
MEQMTALKQAAEARLPYVRVDQQRLDLTGADRGELKLSFSPSVWDAELFLVIDLYSAARQVHPEGHVGWWKWPLEIKADVTVQLVRMPTGYAVTFDGREPQEFWKNPDYSGVDEPVVAVHVVLRPVISEAVRFDDVLYLYNSAAALRAADERRRQLDFPTGWVPSSPWFVWPQESTIHVVSTNAFERDAVGNFAISLHRLFRANGIPCQLYAGQFDPALRETIRHTCELFTAAGEDDVVLLNFSIFEPWLPRLAELTCKKILYFHNITPARFLQVYDAEYAAHCADGLAQLTHLHRFDALVANSTSSARVLQGYAGEGNDGSALDVTVGPPIIGPKAWHEVGPEPIDLPPQSTRLLYVGRIAPHKRIEDLFALFERYHELDPDSALLIVGAARFEGYIGFLRYLLKSEYAPLAPHIHFLEGVSDGQLKTLYQSCAAFVTMSEHEGFCVPVVEAMMFDKPVFAFADEAVLETLGRSGRVFYSKEFPAIAADLRSVLTTSWKQRSIVAAQRERMKQIVQQADGQAFWATLEKVVFGARAV